MNDLGVQSQLILKLKLTLPSDFRVSKGLGSCLSLSLMSLFPKLPNSEYDITSETVLLFILILFQIHCIEGGNQLL